MAECHLYMKVNLTLLEINKKVKYKVKPRLRYLNFGNEWHFYSDGFLNNFQESQARIHGLVSLVYEAELDSP